MVFFPDNMEFRTVAERQLLFQLINKATFSVDTFFFIRYNQFIYSLDSKAWKNTYIEIL